MARRNDDFIDFAAHLFPDLDPGDLYHANPKQKLPKDVSDLLDLVACGTGVPKSWLEKSARLVLDGLAGCQCLWYLHGAEGEIEAELLGVDRLGVPRQAAVLSHDQADELYSYLAHQMVDGGKLKAKYGADESRVRIDWSAGYVFDEVSHEPDVFVEVRRTKLGKWLRKHGASPELIKAFETRQLPVWQWKISTHPFDVLTMSFNRPWTSCMAPGGAAELGPLTDMAAGTAVMFFYRPGAAKPCGRRLLRPVVLDVDDFGITDGGRTYGSGPEHFGHNAQAVMSDMLKAASGHSEPFYGILSLCQHGQDGRALTRYIYSDADHAYCQQTDKQYADAYARLLDAPWPPSRLDLGDLYDRAVGLRELVGHETVELFVDVVRDIADAWASQSGRDAVSLVRLRAAAGAGDIPSSPDIEYASSRGLTEEQVDDLRYPIIERFEEMIEEMLVETPSVALVLVGGEEETSVEFFVEDYNREATSHPDIQPFVVGSLEHFGIATGDVVVEVILDGIRDAGVEEEVQAIVFYPEGAFDGGLQRAFERSGFDVMSIRLAPGVLRWDWNRW